MNTLLCNVGEYGVIVNQQEEFLIVKLAASEKFPEEKRMLPGGRLQENDYPELGLQREVKEETWLKIKVMNPIHVAKRDQKYSVFFLCTVTGNQEVQLSQEHIESKWVKFSENETIDRHNNNSKIAVDKARIIWNKK